MNSNRVRIGVWPDEQLGRLFNLSRSGSFEATYQGVTGNELTIIMSYDGEEQAYVLPLNHVLMYTIWEEETDDSTA